MRVSQWYMAKRIFRLAITVFTVLMTVGCVFTPAASQSTPAVMPETINPSTIPSTATESRVEPQGPAPAASPTKVFLPLVSTAAVTFTPPPPPGGYKNIIFLHHSTGRNLIEQGGVRKAMHDLGYEFWDHDYNDVGQFGLNRPTTSSPYFERTGTNYSIPDDNTDIYLAVNMQGLNKLFAQELITSNVPPLPEPCEPQSNSKLNAFTCLMRHQVIIIKSCYPNAGITNSTMLEKYKEVYTSIANTAAKYPDHIFITMGFPPLRQSETNSADAQRAREFMNWLKSSAIVNSSHPNFYVFDFFDQLADSDNFLKDNYEGKPEDSSHPNQLANQTVGPKFVQFVDQAIKDYTASGN